MICGGGESQLVIPQGEDEHDCSTLSGIASDHNTGSLFNGNDTKTLNGLTATGGTEGVDWELYDPGVGAAFITIKTATPITVTTHGVWLTNVNINAADIPVVNLTLMDFHGWGWGEPVRLTRVNRLNLTIVGQNTFRQNQNGAILISSGPAESIIDITGDPLASLDLGDSPIGRAPIWSNNANVHRIGLIVNGPTIRATLNGQLTHDYMGPKLTQVTRGSGNINGYIFPRTSPAGPQVSLVSSTTQQVTVSTQALDFATPHYSLDGMTWQTSPIFTELKAGHTYNIHTKFIESAFRLESETSITPISTKSAVYTVNIPATMQADGTSVDITVDNTLDLGHNGQVDVKITGGTIQDNGRLQLYRLNSGDMIRSQLLVDDEIFNVRMDGVRQSVATFTMTNQDPVPISFAAPGEATILAGRYEGTVVFGISYSD
jgi:hypothetical protein